MDGWIGVDLDGTLAHYEGWVDELHIGAPIPKMVERVKMWLAAGIEVRILTARVAGMRQGATVENTRLAIQAWCSEHLGAVLPVTNEKDFGMRELWDDRAVGVAPNTGISVHELYMAIPEDIRVRYFPGR